MWESIAFRIIQGPGWALLAYLVVAQCTAGLSYEFGVRLSTEHL